MSDQTRELWLTTLADNLMGEILSPIIDDMGLQYPSCKFSFTQPPSGKAKSMLGCCFPSSESTGAHNEIYVSPVQSDPLTIAIILLHEMIHAIDDCISGHTGLFATIAHKAGFFGSLATFPPQKEWDDRFCPDMLCVLQAYVDEVGELPHDAMKPNARIKPKQKSRKLKVECNNCRWMFEVSQKQLDAMNSTVCLSCGSASLKHVPRNCN